MLVVGPQVTVTGSAQVATIAKVGIHWIRLLRIVSSPSQDGDIHIRLWHAIGSAKPRVVCVISSGANLLTSVVRLCRANMPSNTGRAS